MDGVLESETVPLAEFYFSSDIILPITTNTIIRFGSVVQLGLYIIY
jgi:hypothetical protein